MLARGGEHITWVPPQRRLNDILRRELGIQGEQRLHDVPAPCLALVPMPHRDSESIIVIRARVPLEALVDTLSGKLLISRGQV